MEATAEVPPQIEDFAPKSNSLLYRLGKNIKRLRNDVSQWFSIETRTPSPQEKDHESTLKQSKIVPSEFLESEYPTRRKH